VRPSNLADTERHTVSCDLCGSDRASTWFVKGGDTYVRCRGCNLVYLNPQPSDAELGEIYGDSYYDAWGLDHGEESVARLKRRTFRGLLKQISLVAGASGPLLDVGCATGYLLEEARAQGYDPYGVELNPLAARIARERIGVDRIHCGTLEEAGFASGSMRVAVMSDLLEHVRRPSQLLRATRELLSSEGILAIVAPNLGGLSRRLLGPSWTDFKREHLFSFDKKTLSDLLSRNGFRVLKARAFPKHLDLQYVERQLSTYPTPLFTPLVRSLRRIAPGPLARLPVPLYAGSMLVLARKAA
jgi:2-polyprenyl-3-methyl-5-hydroxy-6-metoxy-1,4-benzoquinol methylase